MSTATTNNDKRPLTKPELREMLRRAEQGDASTLPAVKEYLENPDAVNSVGNLVVHTEHFLTKTLAGNNLVVKEAIKRKLEMIRLELAGPKPSPIERLLAERIATCWLQLQDADLRFTQAGEMSLKQADYHQRRIDCSQKRYLSAIKTLATVRRLAISVLIGQVNIAEKQVNKVQA